jgi:hypothetical protein
MSQTRKGGDSESDAVASQDLASVNLRVREERAGDGETGHVGEPLGMLSIEERFILGLTVGTLVQTPAGMRKVEQLRDGNAISIHNPLDAEAYDAGILVKVLRRTIRPTELTCNPRLLPVKIKAGALGNGLPHRDLVVSQRHRILVSSGIAERMFGTREVLIAAFWLTDLPGIHIDESSRSVEYVHLLLERHEIILAEGAPTESVFADSEALNAIPQPSREEILSIFPEIELQAQSPISARPIPSGRNQKHLIHRHRHNAQELLC